MTEISGNIDSLKDALKAYKTALRASADIIARQVGETGAEAAMAVYDATPYTGSVDAEVHLEQHGQGQYVIVASGRTVLFLEFGAGVTYNFIPHPQAAYFGYGPETYPGQKHAGDPRGWFISKSRGGGHTFGNPASMAMYNTSKALREKIPEIAMGVFGK